MTPLLIAEELFLLTHDDDSGKTSSAFLAPDNATAGALLLDLAERGVLEIDDKKVYVTGEATDHALLDEAQQAIAASDKPRTVDHWMHALPGKLKPMREKVGRSLVDRGILEQQRAKVLGLFNSERWPEVDPVPEQELRSGLQRVLLTGAVPTEHQALLVPLLDGHGLIRTLVDKPDRKAAQATAKAMSQAAKEGKLLSAAVSESAAATQAAVMTTIMMPAVITTTIT